MADFLKVFLPLRKENLAKVGQKYEIEEQGEEIWMVMGCTHHCWLCKQRKGPQDKEICISSSEEQPSAASQPGNETSVLQMPGTESSQELKEEDCPRELQGGM